MKGGDLSIEVMFENLHSVIGIDAESLLTTLKSDSNDWGFIIKLCAAIEAALSHLLSVSLDERVRKNMIRAPLIEGPLSKLELCKSLGLLAPETRKFVIDIGELRNSLAHDIKKVNFSLADYLRGLKKENKQKFKSISENFLADEKILLGDEDRIRMNLRNFAILMLLKLFAQVYIHHHDIKHPDPVSK